MTSPDVIAELEALYATLPTVECVGLCWNSCGPVDMTIAERERIAERGVEIVPFSSERAQRWAAGEPLHCAALNHMRRCSIYDIRPLICRIYGVARGELACRHGCEVSGPRLKLEDVLELQTRAFLIGGDLRETNWGDIDPRVFRDPDVTKYLIMWMRGDRSIGNRLMEAARAALDRLGAQ